MMNAKTQFQKRVTPGALLESRIRLIFFTSFCLFISNTAYSQNTIKSIDGEDAACIGRNMTVSLFDTEESVFSSKNVFYFFNRTVIISIPLLCLYKIKNTYYKNFFSDFIVSLISDSQVSKNISKHFISHSYAVRPPPYLI